MMKYVSHANTGRKMLAKYVPYGNTIFFVVLGLIVLGTYTLAKAAIQWALLTAVVVAAVWVYFKVKGLFRPKAKS